MPNKRIPREKLRQDVVSMNGLNVVPNYRTHRSEATPEALQSAHQNMVTKQQIEKEQAAIAKESAEAARQAEKEFHDGVTAMKESVKGQFGSKSQEAIHTGAYKPKSNRPATNRKVKET